MAPELDRRAVDEVAAADLTNAVGGLDEGFTINPHDKGELSRIAATPDPTTFMLTDV
jgi:hypothetical protein